ncbi:hypothetical protein X975_14356, partial [Stegodyphus mimosarum]
MCVEKVRLIHLNCVSALFCINTNRRVQSKHNVHSLSALSSAICRVKLHNYQTVLVRTSDVFPFIFFVSFFSVLWHDSNCRY